MKELDDLIDISHRYGKDTDYVIAGGGNTSYKNDQYIWIKGSGTSLATIEADGFVRLNRDKLREIADKTYPENAALREEQVKNDLNAAIEDRKGKRPSVETSLHELLDYAYVVHTHPAKVNGLTCSKSAEKSTVELFGDEALFISYTDPGYTLFKVVDNKVSEYKAKNHRYPKIVVLENHGIFVSADTTGEIDEIYDLINRKLDSVISIYPPEFAGKCVESTITINGEEKVKIEKRSPLISYFTDRKERYNLVNIAFTPDNIVYCKAYYPMVHSKENLIDTVTKFNTEKGYLPRVTAIEKDGIVVIEDSLKSAHTVVEVFEDMLKTAVYTENFGGAKAMTSEQIAFIDNWEVENYRRKVSKE